MTRYTRTVLLFVWIFHGSSAVSILPAVAFLSSRPSSFSSRVSSVISLLLSSVLIPLGNMLFIRQ